MKFQPLRYPTHTSEKGRSSFPLTSACPLTPPCWDNTEGADTSAFIICSNRTEGHLAFEFESQPRCFLSLFVMEICLTKQKGLLVACLLRAVRMNRAPVCTLCPLEPGFPQLNAPRQLLCDPERASPAAGYSCAANRRGGGGSTVKRLPPAQVIIPGQSWDRTLCCSPCFVGILLLPLPAHTLSQMKY